MVFRFGVNNWGFSFYFLLYYEIKTAPTQEKARALDINNDGGQNQSQVYR
ncbi:Uncharacterised protein [Streptococcus pneumoniae]|nr:Uncharacterised protein [Streptococcus pneumoniae]CVR11257.1 Uncharacterised protein [Streptococcus pneumoniae]